MIDLDPDRCYRAAKSRDERFDGWFYIAVRTTGIYCRPSCPAITPMRKNVDFYPSAAAAQQHGFRACKRCRPDAAPGSPEWDTRSDVVARAMRLIADGVVDRDGVAGLAGRVSYSSRHLTRVLTEELGAGPLSLARAQRAQTARILIETSDMTMTDIAFAAGFGSVRQFNDTIRDVFASSPSDLRRRSSVGSAAEQPGAVAVRLATRQPFAGDELFSFLAARAVPGVEHWDGTTLRRALDLPRGHGTVALRLDGGSVRAEFVLSDWRDLAPAVGRVRRLLDLNADPVAIDEALGADATLRSLVGATPGRRAPGSVDPFETAVRGIIGQQVSVSGARTVTGRIVAAVAEEIAVHDPILTHVFPSPEQLASADVSHFSMPKSRVSTIQLLARRVADGDLVLDTGIDRSDLVNQLVALKGIGGWTAKYVLMRGLGDPDVFLDSDLGVRHAMAAHGISDADAAGWHPWSSYAVHHLWASL